MEINIEDDFKKLSKEDREEIDSLLEYFKVEI